MTVVEAFKKHEVPMPRYGIEHADGWADIVDRLLGDLVKLGWNKEVYQVKEKFGGLRFYIGEADVRIFDRIAVAEKESMLTCEGCGQPGDCKSDCGWMVTRCKECLKKRREMRAAYQKA